VGCDVEEFVWQGEGVRCGGTANRDLRGAARSFILGRRSRREGNGRNAKR